MSERPIENLTLREMFTDVERLTRELIDHLDRGFLPKAQALLKLVDTDKLSAEDHVEDITIRNHAARLLESEAFTDKLYDKVANYCVAIDREVTRIAGGN